MIVLFKNGIKKICNEFTFQDELKNGWSLTNEPVKEPVEVIKEPVKIVKEPIKVVKEPTFKRIIKQ